MKRKRCGAFLVQLAVGGLMFGLTATVVHGDPPATPTEQEQPLSRAQIDKWIQQLGDAKIRTRDRATKALIAAGVPAARAVWKAATESKDAEVRIRAMQAARESKRRRCEQSNPLEVL